MHRYEVGLTDTDGDLMIVNVVAEEGDTDQTILELARQIAVEKEGGIPDDYTRKYITPLRSAQ